MSASDIKVGFVPDKRGDDGKIAVLSGPTVKRAVANGYSRNALYVDKWKSGLSQAIIGVSNAGGAA